MDYSVIFDMDGVIFDTERMYLECCVPAAKGCGLNGIEEAARKCIGLTKEATERCLRDYFGEEAPIDQFHKNLGIEFRKRYEEAGIPVKRGAVEILTWLKEERVPVALASSTESAIVRKELADENLDRFFDVIIGGEMAARSKPAPDIFLQAAELLKRDPAECFVIEDSFNGVRAGTAAGMNVIMVPDMLPPDDEMYAKAFAIKSSLFEVLEYFRQL